MRLLRMNIREFLVRIQPIRMQETVRLAWPIAVSMLSYTLMGVADTLFVARMGTEAIAAIGMSISVTFLVLSFGMGIMAGLKVAVAQAMGARQFVLVRRLLWQGLWLALLLGIVGVMLVPAGALIFGWMGASPQTSEHARAYFEVRIAATPILFGSLAAKSWFEGRGDTRTPMHANVWANLMNIALDPILIFGWGVIPQMGMRGAAIATVVSQVLSLLWLLIAARRELSNSRARVEATLVRRIIRLGAPLGVSRALDVGAWVVFTAVLARIGDAHLAAHVLAIRIIGISFLPGFAIGEASSVLVGQAVGARQWLGARQAWWSATVLASALMLGWAIVFVLAPRLLLVPFAPQPDVARIAATLLMIGAAFQVFDAIAMVSYSSLSGAGDTRFVMFTSIAGAWLVNVPVALFSLHMDWGAVGAWLGITLEIAVLAFLNVWRIRSGRWLDFAMATAQSDASRAEKNALVRKAS